MAGRGYGSIGAGGRKGKQVGAHRVAWELATGESIPEDTQVLHVCDTPGCVRNDGQGTYDINEQSLPRWGHLFLGEQVHNMADMAQKGRAKGGSALGSANGNAVVDETRAIAIRQGFAEANMTKKAFAESLGLSESLVGDIINRRTWRHV